MLFNRSGIHVFNEYDFRTVLEAETEKLKKEVEHDVKSGVITSESEYIAEKIEKHKILPLEFEQDKLTVSMAERMIPASFFPQGFFVRSGESYPKQVISFHLSFKGDQMLLRCVPSSRILWTEEVLLGDEEIVFDIVKFSDSADDIKREKDQIIEKLIQQASNVNNQVVQHNSDLESVIKNTITSVGIKISKDSEFLGDLGVPLKK